MTKDTINKKIERLGAQEFHLADAFLGASVMLAIIAMWIAFAVPPKATKAEIESLENRIEWHNKNISQVLEFLKTHDNYDVFDIDGSKAIDVVHKTTLEKINL